MRHHPRSQQGLALGLAALAGYVDALGFLSAGGLFVSFMSGNSTRLAVGAARHSPAALIAASIIGGFLLGVTGGALLAHAAGRMRQSVILVGISLLLAAGAAIARPPFTGYGAPLLMAAAMGFANNVFLRDGEVSVGVTYMTGTLVKVGQYTAAALTGGPKLAWLPYLLLWCSLVVGGIAGAAAYAAWGLMALWVAVAASGLMAAAVVAFGSGPLSAAPIDRLHAS